MKKGKEILIEAQKLRDWMVDIRRDFHQYPELGTEEFRTGGQVERLLQEMGIEYKTGVADTGIVGIIRGQEGGKTVALRADMDALPIQDEKDVLYKSKIVDKMHACGHDAHMTILLGAAKILNDMKDSFKGNVKLLFQPAEETVGGAARMIKEGVMENPRVDAVFGLHVSAEIPVGKIGIRYGQMNAASDSIKIILHGKSSHGAYPHNSVDSILMASTVINSLQTIVSRNVDPRDSAVVTIGTIKGGIRENIIADKVELEGTVRTLDPVTRERVIGRIEKLVTQISEAMGGSGEVIREEGYIPLINDNDCVEMVKENGEEMLGKDNVIKIEKPSLGVEDFAYFVDNTKGAFYRIGCRNEDKGIVYDAHYALFDIDEDCLVYGAALQAKNALSALE